MPKSRLAALTLIADWLSYLRFGRKLTSIKWKRNDMLQQMSFFSRIEESEYIIIERSKYKLINTSDICFDLYFDDKELQLLYELSFNIDHFSYDTCMIKKQEDHFSLLGERGGVVDFEARAEAARAITDEELKNYNIYWKRKIKL